MSPGILAIVDYVTRTILAIVDLVARTILAIVDPIAKTILAETNKLQTINLIVLGIWDLKDFSIFI
ncbi:hypothetical protein Taro_030400 [Colocasia esculenta]|uniref:Uncharacterized protein n=1 Tax=Colocasia esculenta TaxID=4460 RepID=A0A843VP22_COLES|nr:hypothetical protein [Colocasia esculenta]